MANLTSWAPKIPITARASAGAMRASTGSRGAAKPGHPRRRPAGTRQGQPALTGETSAEVSPEAPSRRGLPQGMDERLAVPQPTTLPRPSASRARYRSATPRRSSYKSADVVIGPEVVQPDHGNGRHFRGERGGRPLIPADDLGGRGLAIVEHQLHDPPPAKRLPRRGRSARGEAEGTIQPIEGRFMVQVAGPGPGAARSCGAALPATRGRSGCCTGG